MAVMVIGHRGDPTHAPENTIASFKKAIELGVNGIELDVQMSKDGYLVVIHDEKVDRTTDGNGFVKDYTLKELKNLDAGIKFGKEFAGERIPTLEEVFQLIKRYNVLVNIEVKSGIALYEGIEEKLVEIIRGYDFVDRTVISSFNHYSLRDIKSMAPEMRIGLLYQCGLVRPWYIARRMKAYSLHPFYYNIIPEVVAGCKKHDIKLFPWTVDRVNDMKRMIKYGVDGVITNDPQTLIQINSFI